MATLLALKRRIQAAQNVSKTTKAMQMIAASKLKRAQNAILNFRPYAEKLTYLTQDITSKLEEKHFHPYLQKKDNATKTLVVVVAPDKGLCGALIAKIAHVLLNFQHANPNAIYLTIGKKIERLVASFNKEIVATFNFGTIVPSFDKIYPIITILDDNFTRGEAREVKILFSQFQSVFSQKIVISDILPISLPQEVKPTKVTIFEPKAQELLSMLLPHYLEITVYRALLESYASEQGARMIAMQNATDNALEIARDLNLEYNKARQERITNEILDISGVSFANL